MPKDSHSPSAPAPGPGVRGTLAMGQMGASRVGGGGQGKELTKGPAKGEL